MELKRTGLPFSGTAKSSDEKAHREDKAAFVHSTYSACCAYSFFSQPKDRFI